MGCEHDSWDNSDPIRNVGPRPRPGHGCTMRGGGEVGLMYGSVGGLPVARYAEPIPAAGFVKKIGRSTTIFDQGAIDVRILPSASDHSL